MTYRERREAKAERLREWAAKREAKAAAAWSASHAIADNIPFGQPILVGHHSEGRARRDQARIQELGFRGLEHMNKAREFDSKAANIEAQAERSIYSDDPDAIKRLAERIATLEAERDRVKAYNTSCRKGSPDLSLLDERQQRDIASCLHFQSYACPKGQFPAYHLAGLNANIKRNRDRMTSLETRRG